MFFKSNTRSQEMDMTHKTALKDGEDLIPQAKDTTAIESKNPKGNQPDIVYPLGLKLALLLMSIFVTMFLVSLDRMIISTAIPAITNEFSSVNDIASYASAYLITSCAFQLLFGKIYTIFSIKATFMTAILLFEVGSALCGAAPNSTAFILGRAIAGLGSGGLLAGIMVVIVYAVPLHKRPKYQGAFGAIFAVSSTAGPLIGGAFTTNDTWRWCFYLNLPLGGLVMVLIFFVLQIPNRSNTGILLKEKLRQLNALGTIAFLPGVVCLCLALQWGGTTYPWSNGRIIALLVLAFILLIAFTLIQVWKPEQATVPPRIFVQRSIASGFWVACCLGVHMTVLVYYIPIWFQAIDGKSAVSSGINLLPMVIPIAVTSIITGQLISRIGYYTPFLIFGVCLTAIGTGLLTTLEVGTSQGALIGYQIVYGIGLGSCTQTPNMAAQTVLPREQVSIGASLMFFGQQLFGSIFISVSQNLFANQLANRLSGIPGINPRVIQNTGATQLLELVPAQYHAAALRAYNDSLRVCFRLALIMACLSILGAAAMEWRTVKKNIPPKKANDQKTAEEGKSQDGMSKEQEPIAGGKIEQKTGEKFENEG